MSMNKSQGSVVELLSRSELWGLSCQEDVRKGKWDLRSGGQ